MKLLSEYLANYDYDTKTSTVDFTMGADANNDGVINGKDLILLIQYLENYNANSGTSTVVLGGR